jgi:hypothetical protein
MKKSLAALAVVAALVPATAFAQERVGDAALGALSGAVVLGPIGAVAGAVVGFTAGPNIANAWGMRRGSRGAHVARAPRSNRALAARQAPAAAAPATAVASANASEVSAPIAEAPIQGSVPMQGFE